MKNVVSTPQLHPGRRHECLITALAALTERETQRSAKIPQTLKNTCQFCAHLSTPNAAHGLVAIPCHHTLSKPLSEMKVTRAACHVVATCLVLKG
jgi:hypothetical protein